MSRAPAIVIALVLFGTACARQGETSGTTTVTSGSTSGVRVTGARPAQDEIGLRIADEMCAREAACNHIGPDARYRTEEACMADQGARAPLQTTRWTCTPTPTAAGFEQCLASIRSERCETTLNRIDYLVACRAAAVCGR